MTIKTKIKKAAKRSTDPIALMLPSLRRAARELREQLLNTVGSFNQWCYALGAFREEDVCHLPPLPQRGRAAYDKPIDWRN